MTRQIDAARVLRALGLTVTVVVDGGLRYLVVGGEAPHHVERTGPSWTCDCGDARFRPTIPCKHRLAVYVFRQLAPAVRAALAAAVEGRA